MTLPSTATVPLHRVQFLPPVPSPIVALAFPPLPLPPARDPSAKGKAPERIRSQERPEFPPLVVARENGEVEIWSYCQGESEKAKGNWVLSKILPPTLTHASISLMALVLRDPTNFHRKEYFVPRLEDLRLFTAGSDSIDLVERCLHSGRILNVHSIPSPPLWSIAVSPTHSLLCLATSSPNLHFLSIPSSSTDNPALQPPPPELLRSDNLPARCRTVSMAWGPPSLLELDGEWTWRDSYLVTGHSDSSFRKFEIPLPSSSTGASGKGSGRVVIKSRGVVERVRLAGKGNKKPVGKSTIVWGVAVLPDHTIVTSDSLGVLSFWDPQSMAQIDSVSAHKADIMTLTVAYDGQTVFTSGPDQRIAQFSKVGGRWRMLANRRVHTHDVKAMSIFPPYTPHAAIPSFSPSSSLPSRPSVVNLDWAPVLVSGGWDMSPHFTCAAAPSPSVSDVVLRNPLGRRVVQAGQDAGGELTTFGDTFIRNTAGFAPNRAQIAGRGGLVLWREERGVGIWRIRQAKAEEGSSGWEKVLEMDLKLRTNLIASAISPSGRWLAVSDLYETKLFRLSAFSSGTTTGDLRARRVKCFLPALVASTRVEQLEISSQGCGASALHFAEPESRAKSGREGVRLFIGLVWSGEVVVCDLLDAEDEQEEVKVVGSFRVEEGDLGMGQRAVRGGKRAKQVNGTGNKQSRLNGKPNGPAVVSDSGNQDGNDAEDEDIDAASSDSDSDADAPPLSSGPDRPLPRSHARPLASRSAWPTILTSSPDSQFLALSSFAPSSSVSGGARISIFSLDTFSLYSSLPTLPCSPVNMAFLPSAPGLLICLPTGQLQVFNLDTRRLMPSVKGSELEEVNAVLEGSFTAVLGMELAPSLSNTRIKLAVPDEKHGHGQASSEDPLKVLVWSTDYIATVRLSPSALLSPVAAGRQNVNGSARSRSASTSTSVQKHMGGSARKRRAREAELEANEARRLVSQSQSRSSSVSLSLSAAQGSGSARHVDGSGLGSGAGMGGAGGKEGRAVRVEREKFRGVIGAGWMMPTRGAKNDVAEMEEEEADEGSGEPEMVVIERPYDSYRSTLPPSFGQGLYGRT